MSGRLASRLWAACGGCLLLLAAMAVAADAAHGLDADMMLATIVADGSGKEAVAHALAWPGDPLAVALVLAAAAAVAAVRRRPWEGLAALAVVVGANVTTQALKAVLGAARPDAVLSGHEINPASFPSGHVTAVAAAAIALAFVAAPRWRVPVLAVGAAATLAVGASAVALTWHYPSDVVGGVLVAAAWGLGAAAVLRTAGGAEGEGGGGGAGRLPDAPQWTPSRPGSE